uniref:Uncharacterized protein n=1 Tax=Cucumis melo TaxID=3656 RepID=A0A9I9CH48_CUCME
MLDPPHVHYYRVQHILVLFAEAFLSRYDGHVMIEERMTFGFLSHVTSTKQFLSGHRCSYKEQTSPYIDSTTSIYGSIIYQLQGSNLYKRKYRWVLMLDLNNNELRLIEDLLRKILVLLAIHSKFIFDHSRALRS